MTSRLNEATEWLGQVKRSRKGEVCMSTKCPHGSELNSRFSQRSRSFSMKGGMVTAILSAKDPLMSKFLITLVSTNV